MSCKTLFNSRLVNVATKKFNLGSMSAFSFSSNPSGLGDLGSGAGQGGGDGGTIRSAGGSFGKREAAAEGEYFHKLQQQQLEEIRRHENEMKFHIDKLKEHKEAIEDISKKLKENK